MLRCAPFRVGGCVLLLLLWAVSGAVAELVWPSEIYCEANGGFFCDNGLCIFHFGRCDGVNGCGDNSDEVDCDEHTCAADQIRCVGADICLQKPYFCDGEDNCGNGYDEEPDVCASLECSGDYFRCGTGQCVHRAAVCEGYDHCGDNSDEENCDVEPCLDSMVKCPGSHKCIYNFDLCDGENDCGNDFDEQPENCTPACDDDTELTCDDGTCRSKLSRCDGDDDCPNGSDEASCETDQCPFYEMKCENDRCVPFWTLCNGKDDCEDGFASDENDPFCD